MPLQLAPAFEQRFAEFNRFDEPLAARHDFEGTIALLVELHRMGDGPRVAQQVAGGTELLDDLRARLGGRQPREIIIMTLRAVRVVGFPPRSAPRDGAQCPVGVDDGPHRKTQLAPPRHVGEVAERADHRDAAALFGVGERVRLDRHSHAEQRRHHVLSEQRPVPLIVGMRDERDTGGDQLGAGCFDFHGSRTVGRDVGVGDRERNPVVRARHLAIFELGLCYGRLEIDVPQRRRLDLVRETALQETKKCDLRDALRAPADRGIRHRPVDREAEVFPQVFERLLVLGSEPRAQLDEIRARYRHRLFARLRRRRERRIVRQRRIAPYPVIVLDATFGRQPVIIPSHRIEDGLASHPMEAGNQVGMREREDVADVQRAADGRRRCVDGVHVGAGARSIEAVDARLFPARVPFRFEPFQCGLFRQRHQRDVT